MYNMFRKTYRMGGWDGNSNGCSVPKNLLLIIIGILTCDTCDTCGCLTLGQGIRSHGVDTS